MLVALLAVGINWWFQPNEQWACGSKDGLADYQAECVASTRLDLGTVFSSSGSRWIASEGFDVSSDGSEVVVGIAQLDEGEPVEVRNRVAIVVFDTETGNPTEVIARRETDRSGGSLVRFSPDGTHVAAIVAVGNNPSLIVYRRASGDEPLRATIVLESTRAIDGCTSRMGFTSDNSHVQCGDELFDVQTGERVTLPIDGGHGTTLVASQSSPNFAMAADGAMAYASASGSEGQIRIDRADGLSTIVDPVGPVSETRLDDRQFAFDDVGERFLVTRSNDDWSWWPIDHSRGGHIGTHSAVVDVDDDMVLAQFITETPIVEVEWSGAYIGLITEDFDVTIVRLG